MRSHADTLASDCAAQIDAAQQRPQFLDGDLETSRAGFSRGDHVIARFQPLRPDRKAVPIPIQKLQTVPGSSEILHTDWAPWLSSTVGIPYTARSCAYFDERCMAVPRWFTWKREEPYRENCLRGWSTAQSVEESNSGRRRFLFPHSMSYVGPSMQRPKR